MKQNTQKKSTPRKRTKRKSNTVRERLFETDGEFFLKLVVVALVATIWLRFAAPVSWFGVVFAALPLGALVAALGVRVLESHQADRKIWYAVLVLVAIATLYSPTGIVF